MRNDISHHLEILEAQQINLGLYTTRVTAEDLRRAIADTEGTAPPLAEVEAALHDLVAQGEVIEWAPGLYRSRIAETVRCLRLLRRRLWDRRRPWQPGSLAYSPLLIEDIRVEFRPRTRPRWAEVSVDDAVPSEVPDPVRSQFLDGISRRGITSTSKFQARAITKLQGLAEQGNPHDEAVIISGDTGAGKTEAFLFPILLDILSEPPEQRQQLGVRAVLVYPRIRLARNQLSRLLRYLSLLQEAGGPRLTVGIQNGDVRSNLRDIRTPWAADARPWPSMRRENRDWIRLEIAEGCVQVDEEGNHCEGHYWFAADDPGVEAGCPTLVCERCGHTVDFLHVTKAALEASAPDILIITDVSLSQWLARERYSHLWGLWEGETVTVAPRFLVLDEVHLYDALKGAHIARLIKRFQARVRLAYQQRGDPLHHPIVVGVSATLHDERRFLAKLLDVDPQDTERYGRLHVVKPKPDELVPTEGRERYIFIRPRRLSPTPNNPEFRVNDQTAAIQIVMCALHNLKDRVEWRGLAFFDSINDLRQFRNNYDARPNEGWRLEHEDDFQTPSANQDELFRIRTDRRRQGRPPHECIPGGCARRAAEHTLHECPAFHQGDCWWFARCAGWNQRLTVTNSVYAGSAAELDGADLIPTSPSLEVGYDDDAIQLVYQHKAPPNTANFIQRRGRAGRNPDDSPVIITLLWPYRRDDAFYFFRPEALYDPEFDDLPLNAGNFNVQRTHALLGFFDLLACLRRQRPDVRNIVDVDFTQAGSHYFRPGDDVIQQIRRLDHPQKGRQIVVKRRYDRQEIWFSGGHLTGNHVRDLGDHIEVKGWLSMDRGLVPQMLRPAWELLKDSLGGYFALSDLVNLPFRQHFTYPFRLPPDSSLPVDLLRRFGHKDWHATGSNWLATYRHIDWMLQGDQEETTLIVHYPHPNPGQDGPEEKTAEVTFALTELLPGNVSYRLREPGAIHWTPIPPDGESTFLFPLDAETGQHVDDYLPDKDEITRKPDSIFGVPGYLATRYPNLPFMTVKRLRAVEFGLPNQQFSTQWFWDAEHECATAEAGEERPRLSRRCSARAHSAIVPYIARSGPPDGRQLPAVLDRLFATIDGFLDEGRSMLGYTRAFYELEIDVRLEGQARGPQLHRDFYDETGQRTLVGYLIETQGIRFQVNPDLVAEVVQAVLDDEPLRLHLRRQFAIYQMGTQAATLRAFPGAVTDRATVAVDYWLHRVVPADGPRELDAEADREPLVSYFDQHRIAISAEVNEFRQALTGEFIALLNQAIQTAFRDTAEFREYVESVLLHSLSALLKGLIARLGGVQTDDLVAYADLPLLRNVDRTVEPRILIMDTIAGGSGAIAQAFERLDLTTEPGSLWWMLQTELGSCPIANGERLVGAALTRATPAQIQAAQDEGTEAGLRQLLDELGLTMPTAHGLRALGRILFAHDTIYGQEINTALLLQELFRLQADLDAQRLAAVPREATVRQATRAVDEGQMPRIAALRDALGAGGVEAHDPLHELAVQLHALYESACADGCPICLGAGSDIEHYHLAEFLNSRRVLEKLRHILFAPDPTTPSGDCLTAVAEPLLVEPALEDQPGPSVRVIADPGTLGNRLARELGLGVVAQVGADGQVIETVTTAVDPERAREFLRSSQGWQVRWGGDEHKPYRTPNGVRVRSLSECYIATRFEELGIAYLYEHPLAYVDEVGRAGVIHPDFYLPQSHLYVEFWGRDDPEYIESRRFKEGVYEREGVMVVHLEPGDVQNDVFLEKLRVTIDNSDARR